LIIEWSLFAVEDRTRIFDYIEQDDPMAAVAVDERIMAQTANLAQFPESGRLGRVEGTGADSRTYSFHSCVLHPEKKAPYPAHLAQRRILA